MVEPTTTRLTFTVDAETYQRVEDAQATVHEAFDRSLHAALHPADFPRPRRVELLRELAQARRELAEAYQDLLGDLICAGALARPLARGINELRGEADQDEQFAAEMERSEAAS